MTTIDRFMQIGDAVRHVVIETGDDGAGTAVIDDGD